MAGTMSRLFNKQMLIAYEGWRDIARVAVKEKNLCMRVSMRMLNAGLVAALSQWRDVAAEARHAARAATDVAAGRGVCARPPGGVITGHGQGRDAHDVERDTDEIMRHAHRLSPPDSSLAEAA